MNNRPRNPNILYMEDLQEMTGCTTPVQVLNRLKKDNIKVFNTAGGRYFTTIQLVNAAGGVGQIETGASKQIL